MVYKYIYKGVAYDDYNAMKSQQLKDKDKLIYLIDEMKFKRKPTKRQKEKLLNSLFNDDYTFRNVT